MTGIFSAVAASLIIAIPFAARAQGAPQTESVPQQLTLEEAINIAMRNNYSYAVLLNDGEVNEAARRNAFSRLLPVPSASFSTGLGPSRSSGPFGTTTSSSSSTNLSAGISMNLWDGGRSLNTYRQSKMAIENGNLTLAAREHTLRSTITTQYYEAQRSERALELERRMLSDRRTELEDAKKRFRVAMVGVLDMDRAEQAVRQYENQVENAEDNVVRSKLTLLGTMGIHSATTFTLVTPLPAVPASVSLNVDSLVGIALANNPELRQVEYNVEQTRTQNRLTRRSRFMPSVRLNANFNRGISQQGYGSFLDPAGRNSSLSANLGISLPLGGLVDLPGTNLQMAQSDASLYDAQLNLREQKLSLQRQVQTAVLDLESAYRSLRFAEQAVINARRQLLVAQQELSVGRMTPFTYQQIVDQASNTERDVLTQQLNVLTRTLTLDRLLGNRPGG